jgi:hypothetical protein
MSTATIIRQVCDADAHCDRPKHQAERIGPDGVRTLLFCQHHFNEHQAALELAGYITGPILPAVPAPRERTPFPVNYTSW